MADDILTFKVDVTGWTAQQIDSLVLEVVAQGEASDDYVSDGDIGHPSAFVEVSRPRARCEECGDFNNDEEADMGEETACGTCSRCARPLCLHTSDGGTWLVDETCALGATP